MADKSGLYVEIGACLCRCLTFEHYCRDVCGLLDHWERALGTVRPLTPPSKPDSETIDSAFSRGRPNSLPLDSLVLVFSVIIIIIYYYLLLFIIKSYTKYKYDINHKKHHTSRDTNRVNSIGNNNNNNNNNPICKAPECQKTSVALWFNISLRQETERYPNFSNSNSVLSDSHTGDFQKLLRVGVGKGDMASTKWTMSL